MGKKVRATKKEMLAIFMGQLKENKQKHSQKVDKITLRMLEQLCGQPQ